MKVVTTRAYLETPVMLASDIAADLKDSNLPEDVKRRLTPSDDTAIKRANATAARWISTSLFTSGVEPVAVIVLWRDQPNGAEPSNSTTTDGDDTHEILADRRLPTFILLKGEYLDGRFRVRQICYGDPLPLASTASDASGD